MPMSDCTNVGIVDPMRVFCISFYFKYHSSITLSGSSQTSGSSVIATQPPSINDIRGWSTAELIQHLEAKFPDDLDHEDLGILQKRKIRGRAFLEMTGDKLEKYGMEGGPAIVIA